jgi:hypothetical protein
MCVICAANIARFTVYRLIISKRLARLVEKSGLASLRKNSMQKLSLVLVFMVLVLSLVGCDQLLTPELATPLPTEFLPTAIAQTLQARAPQPIVESPATAMPDENESTAVITQEILPTVLVSETPEISPTFTLFPDTPEPVALESLTATATLPLPEVPLSSTLTLTPVPVEQDARVQIYKLGDLSKVVSPLVVTSRLTSRVGKVVRFELFGEDGRLLARQVKVYFDIPWHVATLTMDLEFEIRAAAELGRLVVSVEDSYGRMIDVNSVNLILLSSGSTELNPASALKEAIVIQDPQPNALVVGGKVYVSGIAKPFEDQPLKVVLIAQDGRVLGQRLAGVDIPIPGGYGTFFADVSYSVTEVTEALLVIYESGGLLSEYAHLTSMDVVLAP